MWNLTNSRYIHRERLSPFFPVSFSHCHCKINNIKIVLVLLFIFLFIAFNNFENSSSLKKKNGTVPCLCHTSSTRKTSQSSNSNQQQKHLKMQKKPVCVGRGACSAFILLSPVLKKYLTLLKFQSNQTLVFQRFTRIPFEKLCNVRRNNVQKKTLMVADAGCLHWSPNSKEHQ